MIKIKLRNQFRQSSHRFDFTCVLNVMYIPYNVYTWYYTPLKYCNKVKNKNKISVQKLTMNV